MEISVKKGDTLYNIAKTYGTTVDALKQANGISDPRKLKAGSSISIPGSYTNAQSNSISGMLPAYGTSGQGGYKNVTNYDGAGKPYYGYEKIGTAFTPNGQVVNNPYMGTKGIFEGAGALQMGYLEHESGYKGMGYKGQDGRYYTDYKSLLREDGHLYPEGAKISKNGMYFDNGYGMQSANTGIEGIGGVWSHMVFSPDTSGVRPNQRLNYFDNYVNGPTGGANITSTAGNGGGDTANEQSVSPEDTQAVLNLLEFAYKNLHQKEWEEYQRSKKTDY